MSNLIYTQDAIEAIYNAFSYAYCDNCENNDKDDDSCEGCHRKYQNWRASKKVTENVINSLPSAGPDKAVIDNLLFNINLSISPHASTTSVIAIKHCIQALYEEIYGEGAKPKWMI